MELKRFFIDCAPVCGQTVTISGEEYHHIVTVTRHKVGYSLILCAGDGYDCLARITEIRKDSLSAEILERTPNAAEWAHSLTLFTCVTKGEKMDVIVQKAVELGVREIVPVLSAYSQRDAKLGRLQKIADEACKQCGRAYRVCVKQPIELSQLPYHEFDRVFFPYEREQKRSFADISTEYFSGQKIALLVGSEGGFSEQEGEAVRALGGLSFSLGRRILRAETAVITCISLLSLKYGEMGCGNE